MNPKEVVCLLISGWIFSGCASFESLHPTLKELDSKVSSGRSVAWGGAAANNPIVGGVTVSNSDPEATLAVMILVTRKSRLHVCSSVLVGPQALLTAAHCVAGVDKKDVKIAFPLSIVKTREQALDMNPEKIVIHEKFDGNPKNKSDLAILKLPFPAPREYSPVPILDPTEKVMDDNALLLGFGITSETRSDSMTLRKTYKSWSKDIELRKEFFGIHQSNTSGGFCRGDSGAPVLVTVSGGYRRLAGLNSFTVGIEEHRECHTASVAMYLPHFTNWIKTHASLL